MEEQSKILPTEEAGMPPFWLKQPGNSAEKCWQCRTQAVWWDLFTALGDALFMNLLGMITGSMALHAQGLQSLGDFFNKGITIFSIKTATKPPNRRYPYGFGKVLFLSAALVGSSLFLGSLAFIYGNLRHIDQGLMAAPDIFALLGPVMSMLASYIMYRYLQCVSEQSNNLALAASAMDNRQDFLSASALLLGILFSILGWPIADHLSAILVSIFTTQIGFSIASRAIHGLLDGTVPDYVLRQVRDTTLQTPGVLGVAHLRGRMLGEIWEIDLKILVDGTLPTSASHQIAVTVQQRVMQQVKYTGSVHVGVFPQ